MSRHVERIEQFRALLPGWDSYGAVAIEPKAIETALSLADKFEGSEWDAFPMPDGGIQFERSDGVICVEIHVAED